MRVKVNVGLKDYEGNFMVDNVMKDGQPVLDENKKLVKYVPPLRVYLMNALNSQLPDEQLVAEDKSLIYHLTNKIYSAREVQLTPKEVSYIEDRAGKAYPPLVFGRICDMLEGNEVSNPTYLETAEDVSLEAPVPLDNQALQDKKNAENSNKDIVSKAAVSK